MGRHSNGNGAPNGLGWYHGAKFEGSALRDGGGLRHLARHTLSNTKTNRGPNSHECLSTPNTVRIHHTQRFLLKSRPDRAMQYIQVLRAGVTCLLLLGLRKKRLRRDLEWRNGEELCDEVVVRQSAVWPQQSVVRICQASATATVSAIAAK